MIYEKTTAKKRKAAERAKQQSWRISHGTGANRKLSRMTAALAGKENAAKKLSIRSGNPGSLNYLDPVHCAAILAKVPPRQVRRLRSIGLSDPLPEKTRALRAGLETS